MTSVRRNYCGAKPRRVKSFRVSSTIFDAPATAFSSPTPANPPSLSSTFAKTTRNVPCTSSPTTSRRGTSLHAPLDRDTVAVSDKFGNFAALRLPKDVSDEIESDISGGKHAIVLTSSAALGATNGANNKLQACAQFHVGDVICSLTKCALQTGGSEVIVYATRRRARRFRPVCEQRRSRFLHPPGNALAHRSAASLRQRTRRLPLLLLPGKVKAVVDGDLCEQFGRLKADAQRRISEEMDRTLSEIVKRLEQIRARADDKNRVYEYYNKNSSTLTPNH